MIGSSTPAYMNPEQAAGRLAEVGVSIHPDGRSFAVSQGTPIHIYPMEEGRWDRDPAALLEAAERESGLRLRRFRLVVGAP